MFGIRSSIDYFRMQSRFSQMLELFGHRHWYPKGEDMMISFKRRKMDHSIFCLERSTLALGGPQAGCFYFDCQAPDKTKVVPPWGPERANQDRRVGMLNECQGHFLGYFAWSMWLSAGEYLQTYRSYRLFTVSWERKMLISQYRTHVSTNPDCMFSKQNLDDFQVEFPDLASFATRIFCSRSGWNTDSFWMSRMPRWWDPSREYQWVACIVAFARNLKTSPWMTK